MNQRLKKIYDQLPEIKCRGLCQDSCGPIGMSVAEYNELRAKVGDRIRPQKSDDGQVFLLNIKTLTCPLLNTDGKCSCYDVRPLICRLWGIVKEMRCPFGCVPEKWVKKEDSYAMMSAAEKIT